MGNEVGVSGSSKNALAWATAHHPPTVADEEHEPDQCEESSQPHRPAAQQAGHFGRVRSLGFNTLT
jgi:hypothetical protein